ncbi:MAG: hypothetical protein A2W91_19625 [Bacteroidetes bacterium GWF2_38_335]|nr:MAG: hypothetical protein A2W91_19625 [Bacteroidetes bacterium GWF2_38_335]OFY79966.1 MAG: hypothetical protein A2281_11025 [Bacteroidetes bacterium RIFOXYA12_FULL_38_20]HBS86426.1 hypothetical protein [Bacteroidales bacterium]
MAKIHTFADFDLLPNQNDNTLINLKYGPVSGHEASKYRVSSMFTGSTGSGAEHILAFAVTKGIILVQKASSGSSFNLILKPINQSSVNFTPVKYFIYRGLSWESLITDQINPEFLIPRNNSFMSDLIDKMYDDWDNTDVSASLPSKNLGIHLDSSVLSDSALIEEAFDALGTDFDLPIVEAGDSLGFFDNLYTYGFEIMLEEFGFNPTMREARVIDNIIEITDSLPSNPEDESIVILHKREAILNYIDPAVFYGLHYNTKIIIHQGSSTDKIKGNELYNEVLTKFATKNVVYIDIRNEHHHSFNYYNNYRMSGNNYPKFKLGIGPSPDMNQPYVLEDYHKYRWPMHTEEFDGVTNDSETLILTMMLPHMDNLHPILFVPQKLFKEDKKEKKVFKILNRSNSDWKYTEEFKIETPFYLNSGDGLNYSFPFYVKINYNKIYNAELLKDLYDDDKIITQVGRTITPYTNIDHNFSPFSYKASWKIDSVPTNSPQTTAPYVINWGGSPAEYFKGLTSFFGILFTSIQGVANDGIGEVAYSFLARGEMTKDDDIKEHYSIDSSKLKSINFTAKSLKSQFKSFYEAYYKNYEEFLNVVPFDFEDTVIQSEVEPFEFLPVKISPEGESGPFTIYNFLNSYERITDNEFEMITSFAYTFAEKNSIIQKIQAELSNYSHLYFTVLSSSEGGSIDGENSYIAIELGLSGLDSLGNVKTINLGLTLYSLDQLNFCSRNYFQEI